MRIIIVEDQAMLRESLARALDEQPDMDVVAVLGDASLAPDRAVELRADLMLMDVCTDNDSSGIVAAAKTKERLPQVRTVIMTGMPEITFVQQARDAGVDSFVYKNVGTDELLSVIRSTMVGYSTYPSSRPRDASLALLTDEEVRILRLVCENKSRREIAECLYLSEGTVKRRISEILAKTGYDSIMRLAVHAVSNGYIVPKLE